MKKIYTKNKICNFNQDCHYDSVKQLNNRKGKELHHDCHSELVSESLCHEMLKLVQHDKKSKGFTLAEVLITLTIIGVIAALTIPNLMQKWSDQADVAKVKEAYSILSNAYKMTLAENGPYTEWAWPSTTAYSSDNSIYLGKEISKYLKYKKFYDDANAFIYGWSSNGSTENCGIWCYKKGVSGEVDTSGPIRSTGTIVLDNGMIVTPSVATVSDTSQTTFKVDINGKKKPNRAGYDIFYFGMNGNGLVPQGGYLGKDKNNCYAFAKKSFDGGSCSYWVLRKGNMDYKYRDVSAEW